MAEREYNATFIVHGVEFVALTDRYVCQDELKPGGVRIQLGAYGTVGICGLS